MPGAGRGGGSRLGMAVLLSLTCIVTLLLDFKGSLKADGRGGEESLAACFCSRDSNYLGHYLFHITIAIHNPSDRVAVISSPSCNSGHAASVAQ